MAIALAQDNVADGARDNSSSTTLTVTFTKTTTAGNLAVLGFGASANRTLLTVTDSRGGNTWQVDLSPSTTQGFCANVASCLIATNHQIGDTLTCTINGAATTYMVGIVSEWSGIVSSSWKDKTASANAASGTPSSGVTATRTQASELLYGLIGYNAASDPTSGTGFTPLTVKNSGAGNRRVAPEYQIVSSTGTDAATWTTDPTFWTADIVTYKADTTAAASSLYYVRA